MANQYGSSSSRPQQTQQKSTARSSGNNSAGFLFGCVFLGICLLIAGFNISGSLKKLNTTVTDKVFSDTNSYNAPSELTYTTKKYLTEDEAGAYLNLPTQKIVDLINSGEITEYIKTGSGYSISVTVLDAWFDNEAYQTKLNSVPKETEATTVEEKPAQ